MGMPSTLRKIKAELDSLMASSNSDSGHPSEERLSLLACEEAFRAASEGNYGVGSLLVAPSGEIVARAHNQVFTPYFRSDLHAEMVVMSSFEDQNRELTDMSGYVLFSSIEPCPMCLGRLIMARVRTIKYVAPDPSGGMSSKLSQMPESFRNLARQQEFGPAQASPRLQKLATDIFRSNLVELRSRLFSRLGEQ